MAQAFYGRVEAYDAGLAADTDAVLAEALQRNLFGTVNPQPAQSLAVAAYVRRAAAALAAMADHETLAGNLEFQSPSGDDIARRDQGDRSRGRPDVPRAWPAIGRRA